MAWCAAIATFPIYIGPSGRPQLSTYIVLALSGYIFVGRQSFAIARGDIRMLRALWLFIAYTGVVGVAWAINLASAGPLAAFAFMIYNGLLLLVGLSLRAAWDERFVRMTLTAIAATTFGLIVVWAATGAEIAARNSLTFNNPNQLGYFGLIAVCALALPRASVMNSGLRIVGLAAGIALVGLSLSKAAIIGVVLVAPIVLVVSRRKIWVVIVGCLVAGAIIVPLLGAPIEERLADVGQSSDDSLTGRGYDRISEYPEYLVFGAGEYSSGEQLEVEHELHSTPGTIFFSYGVVGLVLFGTVLWRLLQRMPTQIWLMLLPVGAYGLTHHGLRFSFVWVYVALLMASATPIGPVRRYRLGSARGRLIRV